MENPTMKSLNTKLVLSTFAIVAMFASPAFAKKPQQGTHNNGSAVYGSPVYGAIPGYDGEGGVVEIPDPNQSGSSQR
jgi:hypothetical protein